ncbi:MAG: helix-turn-helix domain-containing protein [Actinomycetota bacterium]|nr:helix-turn-helix domain-containing protein [Actinomycetota bacterium]
MVIDGSDLDRTIRELSASLGDATRRGIYLSVQQAPEPVTVSQIAELFQIHPNVARHHLDRLATDGYLQITRRRTSGRRGPGAGRPAKCYEATDKPIELHFPPRRFDLLAELLVRVVEHLAPQAASEVAEQVGREYGLQLAGEMSLGEEASFEAALQAAAGAMTSVGFASDADPKRRIIRTNHCPFGQAALDHPTVICSLDQGIRRGLMEGFHQGAQPVTTPRHPPQQACVTQL